MKRKQDHRLYTRAQVDFLRITEARKATAEAVKLYNCAILEAMIGKVEPETAQEIVKDAESLFESLGSGTLSFEDCAEDIKKNLGIAVTI